MNRRQFLIGLFGTAAVAAAGQIPAAIEALTDEEFKHAAEAALPSNLEVYGLGPDYVFANIEYLSEPPWFKAIIPGGARPLRSESDRLADEAIARMRKKFPDEAAALDKIYKRT